jgi:hypothetical protein
MKLNPPRTLNLRPSGVPTSIPAPSVETFTAIPMIEEVVPPLFGPRPGSGAGAAPASTLTTSPAAPSDWARQKLGEKLMAASDKKTARRMAEFGMMIS